MKYLLRRVMGDAYFSYEELLAVVTRAEAYLNSRPLTTMSNNPNDLSPLIPGHFLVGHSLTSVPEIEETNMYINRSTHWRRVSPYSRNL